MSVEWRGSGRWMSTAWTRKTGQVVVKIDPRYFRPTEVDTLLGDADQGAHETRLEPRRSLWTSWSRRWSPQDLELAPRDALVSAPATGSKTSE